MNELTDNIPTRRANLRFKLGWVILGLAAWIAAYASLLPFADGFVKLLGLSRATHLGEAIHFFVYDTPKVLLLLTGVVFVMGVIHTFVTPERTRALLSGRRLGVGNVMAASLGVVTPFCSCSAVPLFIGFLSAGVPLGVTFSFLISAPMVNEIALALLFGLFGWQVAALYLGLGLSLAIVAGLAIGRLGMENHLEDWVRAMQSSQSASYEAAQLGWAERIDAGVAHVKEIVGRVWRWILLGIAVGALIHGYVPQDFLASIMGSQAPWWSLPAAVLLGVPMYSNAAGIIPVVEALLGKGAALGTVLAFMMSVIALSLPEMIILRKVLKLPLIATFAGVVAAGILGVGLVFNSVLQERHMQNVKILGTGCANCKNTYALVEEVARARGVPIELEKVEDLQQIMSHGVMSTPGVVIDGKVVHAGGVPARAKVEGWFA